VSAERPIDFLISLLHELCALPKETEWVEFKENNDNPEEIGEYISALANTAALQRKAFAYLVWGVRDADHEIVATSFDPFSAKVGNEELESWLLRLLDPKIDFRFFKVPIEGTPVVVLEIARAARHPVRFKGQKFIRVGSYKKKLEAFPEKERALWRIFDQTPFEDGLAIDRATADEVLQLLDYPAYFDLLELPLPDNREGILAALAADRLIRKSDAGGWDITNLGAILFAKRLDAFRTLRRKAVRVIHYRGRDRTQTLKEQEGGKGYACGFEGLIGFINGLLPSNEIIGQALRTSVPMFPELAVRELVANALIHQDFFITGAGPMVEIFHDRIEITNPGEPLVDTDRFVDTPPRSRNEALASLMRRFRICEERGSGIDKVVAQVEMFQLPAPLFESPEGFTRSVLFAHKPLAAMDKAERIRACYLHACLCYVTRKAMTNTTLRARFGVEDHNRAAVSRMIREAVEARAILPADPEAAPKLMRYLPFWAAAGPHGQP
jgi:predicted HTH transcriptional regulator